MRSLFRHILLLAACLMAARVACAADFNDDGLRYSINADGESVTVVNNVNYNSLTEAFIPEEVEHGKRSYTVTAVADRAFAGAKLLTLVSIPATVRAIGSEAFDDCSSLDDIYCMVKDPAEIALGDNVFRGVSKVFCVLHVPLHSGSGYLKAEQWRAFLNIYEDSYMPAEGDINNDGYVNSGDVSALYELILSGQYDPFADLNDDGQVNAGDISALYSIILGQ